MDNLVTLTLNLLRFHSTANWSAQKSRNDSAEPEVPHNTRSSRVRCNVPRCNYFPHRIVRDRMALTWLTLDERVRTELSLRPVVFWGKPAESWVCATRTLHCMSTHVRVESWLSKVAEKLARRENPPHHNSDESATRDATMD